MAKEELKKRAIELRKQGYSYNLIQKEVPVSKGTLSAWLSDIPFTPNEEVKNRIKGARLKSKQWHKKKKKKSIERAQKKAAAEMGELSERDLLMLGVGLYIGEGTKTHGHVRIINSDPCVINLAIRWFTESFGLSIENFALAIHLYPDNNIEESLRYWSDITGIPRSQFGKTQVDQRKNKSKKRGLLKHGTAHLSVRSNGNKKYGVFLFRKIMAMIDEAYRQYT